MAGRPEFKPTPDQRDQVVKLVACRTSEKDIALRFGIDEKTLRKHFREQLDRGFVMFNTELWLKFANKLQADVKKADFEYWNAHNASLAPSDATAAERAPALGKKELKRVAAGQAGAGTVWENLLRPAQPTDVN